MKRYQCTSGAYSNVDLEEIKSRNALFPDMDPSSFPIETAKDSRLRKLVFSHKTFSCTKHMKNLKYSHEEESNFSSHHIIPIECVKMADIIVSTSIHIKMLKKLRFLGHSKKGYNKGLDVCKRKGTKCTQIYQVYDPFGDEYFDDLLNLEKCISLQRSFQSIVEVYFERFTLENINNIFSLIERNAQIMKGAFLGDDFEKIQLKEGRYGIFNIEKNENISIRPNILANRAKLFFKDEELDSHSLKFRDEKVDIPILSSGSKKHSRRKVHSSLSNGFNPMAIKTPKI